MYNAAAARLSYYWLKIYEPKKCKRMGRLKIKEMNKADDVLRKYFLDEGGRNGAKLYSFLVACDIRELHVLFSGAKVLAPMDEIELIIERTGYWMKKNKKFFTSGIVPPGLYKFLTL